MADDADIASYNIERDIKIARKVASGHKPEAEYTGRCLCCGEETEAPRRWCDADCRDKWQRKRSR